MTLAMLIWSLGHRLQAAPAPADTAAVPVPNNALPGLRRLMDTPLRDTSLCRDDPGQWWSSFFGSDEGAPWRERPGILPVAVGPDGLAQPKATPVP